MDRKEPLITWVADKDLETVPKGMQEEARDTGTIASVRVAKQGARNGGICIILSIIPGRMDSYVNWRGKRQH